jgi:hypothetical protein
MPERYLGRVIEVTTGDDVKVPLSFKLEGREYVIREILESWPDYGYGRATAVRKRWWQKHHRHYYRVKTTDGDSYEIYYERGDNPKNPELKKWFITQKL